MSADSHDRLVRDWVLPWAALASVLIVPVAGCSGSSNSHRDATPDGPPIDVPIVTMETTRCTDSDGDGLEGRYYIETGEPVLGGDPCPLDDCNDANPRQGMLGFERCDGYDNDCDGATDEGVRISGTNCFGQATPRIGEDGDDWEIDDEGEPTSVDVRSRGIEVDDDGALRLTSRRRIRDFIWLADTAYRFHTVSKYSTQPPYRLEGRYCLADPGSPTVSNPCGNADPSRTSVNLFGDVYVGDRNNGRVIKVSAAGLECPDTNGDGVITTWVPDGDDDPMNDPPPLPWGQDDCVVWATNMREHGASDMRGIAAQEVEGPDGEIEQYVWAGGSGGQNVYKLDGDTGEVLVATRAPTGMYGMALDGFGNLWMTNGGSLGRLDTTRCLSQEDCDAAEICATGGADDDLCIKQRVLAVPCGSYGITVDFKSRVWLGGSGMSRYDPRADIGMRWATVPWGGGFGGGPIGGGGSCSPADEFCQPDLECGGFVSGIAADGVGFVWGAGGSAGVVRANADRPAEWAIVEGSASSGCGASTMGGFTAECTSKGMAVDLFGKIWAVNMGDTAMVITPGPEIDNNLVEHGVGMLSGSNRYTYSDMTGIQLRLATNTAGYYQRIFQPCGDNPEVTRFITLDAELEAPEGTFIEWEIRVAQNADELNRADWISAGQSTRDETIQLEDLLADAGVEGRVLEVRARFRSNVRAVREVVSPLLYALEMTAECKILIM